MENARNVYIFPQHSDTAGRHYANLHFIQLLHVSQDLALHIYLHSEISKSHFTVDRFRLKSNSGCDVVAKECRHKLFLLVEKIVEAES
jgi:hypothetical protein